MYFNPSYLKQLKKDINAFFNTTLHNTKKQWINNLTYETNVIT